jgi:hypothetical protein
MLAFEEAMRSRFASGRPLRFVIDGANVAYCHQNHAGGGFSYSQVYPSPYPLPSSSSPPAKWLLDSSTQQPLPHHLLSVSASVSSADGGK